MSRPGNPYNPDNVEVAAIVTANGVTSLTGDVTGTGPGATATTLATVNSNVGSFTSSNITVDAKGRITAAANGSAGGITALTGDVTASGSGSVAATLAAGSASNLNSGTLLAARMPALTGDITSTVNTVATTLANIPTGVVVAGSLLATAITAPGTPAAGKGSIYVDSTSKNIAVKDDAGVVKHGVQTKAAVTSNYITAINDAGSCTAAQPAFTDISGSVAASQMPALTGDMTTVAGAVAVTSVNLGSGVTRARNSAAVAGSATQNLASTLTFPADGQRICFAGKIVGPNATQTWSMEPNSLATNMTADIVGVSDTTLFRDSQTIAYVGDATTTASVYFDGWIDCWVGLERQMVIFVRQHSTAVDSYTVYVRWNVTTTVTGLRLHASTGTGLGIGTTLLTWVG